MSKFIISEQQLNLLKVFNIGNDNQITEVKYFHPQLFDYLHEHFIDYRGLIDEGMAIDVNTLEKNPYE
jgi:hypothetical protein